MKRKNQRHSKLITCCGKSFPAGFLAKHKAGLLHKSARIRALLQQNCISQTEIADRVGVSRERIRQIAKELGFPSGRDRACARVLTSPPCARFRAQCEKRGLRFDLVSARYGYHLKTVLVGDSTVRLRQSCYRPNGYCNLPARSSEITDFTAYELPDRRWLIIPWGDAPAKQTAFAVQPRVNRNAHQPDYRDYIDAWKLLGNASAKVA